MTNEIPRRAYVEKWSVGEAKIREAVEAVETMGADLRLTEAVVLLGKAQDKVADFVDGVDSMGLCIAVDVQTPPGMSADEIRRRLLSALPSASPEAKQHDAVNHPGHYNVGKIEVIEAIEDWRLCFHLGNVVKYVARSGHKGSQLEDLKKARWYLERKISELEGAKP